MANAQQVGFLISGLTDNDGNILAGGKVYTYESGTTSDKATWTDATKTTSATNPVILDSLGRATIYADGNYKFRIDTSADVNVDTIDNLWFGVTSTNLGIVQLKSADYTAASTDDYILVSATSADVVISLPSAATVDGKKYLIKKTDASANTVTVDPNGSETIEGDSTYVLSSQYQLVQVVSDGTNWIISMGSIDEDDMSSDAANKVPTQQSVKAYVDSGTVTMTNKTLSGAKAVGTLIGTEVIGTDSNNYTCIATHTSSTDNKPITGGSYASYWVAGGENGAVWATATTYTKSAVLDDDTFSSDDASAVPSQQSTKAYVDTSVASAIPDLASLSFWGH